MTDAEQQLTVSVVVPLHDGASFVARTIESIAGQLRQPLEVIVVDDGSTDGGAEVATSVDTPFPVRLIRRDEAGGQSLARNVGVAVAEGELVAFCDQDDVWHPEHLAVLAEVLDRNPSVGWAYCDFDEIDAVGRVVTVAYMAEHGVQHPKRTLAACVAEDLMVLPSSSVLRRTAFDELGGFDEELQGYEDDDLYVRAFRSGWQLVFVDRPLTRFRVHGASSSASGTFARSRMRYSEKLRAAIDDDRHRNRYWYSDVVAPRFFTMSVHDYVRAVNDEDWDGAAAALAAAEHFGRQRGSDPLLRLKLLPLRSPRTFRRLLQVNQSLPRALRITRNPTLRLR